MTKTKLKTKPEFSGDHALDHALKVLVSFEKELRALHEARIANYGASLLLQIAKATAEERKEPTKRIEIMQEALFVERAAADKAISTFEKGFYDNFLQSLETEQVKETI